MSGGAKAPWRVAIVGGGLAGLAAALELTESRCHVEVFEARKQFGGRVASFRDPSGGEEVDYCQHVSMGCCTKLADFCRRVGVAAEFDRYGTLHFFLADGRRFDFGATSWLPAPLHLLPAFLRLGYLSLRDRLAIIRCLLQLRRMQDVGSQSVGDWLRSQGQSAAAINDFWSVVLNSALGESLDRAGMKYARQVFVEGFMQSRRGYEVLVPREPLSELFGRRAVDSLASRGVVFHPETPVSRISYDGQRAHGIELADGRRLEFDGVVLAVPWRRVLELIPPGAPAALHRQLAGVAQLASAPITGVHLWFDRPITRLPHAVLIGTLSQWLFQRSGQSTAAATSPAESYYQVVISASYTLESRDKQDVAAQVVEELRQVFPAARGAKLLRNKLVTDPHAVFSAVPNVDELRPAQATSIKNLALAGDWTRTEWPATMEGAVRSGYLAAEVIAQVIAAGDSGSV